MPYYELLCLASGKLDRPQLTDVIRKTCLAFMDNGATVTRVVPLGANGNGPRKLAYKIRINQVSYESGFYVNICAFSSPAVMNEVRRLLRIDERVLRHMVLKRSLLDAVTPIPDVHDLPPVKRSDPRDPDAALNAFLREYQRDFPEGLSLGEVEAPSHDAYPDTTSGDDVIRKRQETTVEDIVERLKAASPSAKEKVDPGLAWISKLKTPDPSDDSSK